MERHAAISLAARIVDRVHADGLRMGLITGSVARDLADESSDLDVYLYVERLDLAAWSDPRRFEAIGARTAFGVATDGGWFTKLEHDGRYVDVEIVEVSVLARAVDALSGDGSPAGWVVKLAAGVRDAIAIHGHEELALWQDRLAYPDHTATAEVAARCGRLLAPSALFDLTHARGDVLSFTARLSQLLLDVVALLGAVNRRFIPVEDPKWIAWHVPTDVPSGRRRRPHPSWVHDPLDRDDGRPRRPRRRHAGPRRGPRPGCRHPSRAVRAHPPSATHGMTTPCVARRCGARAPVVRPAPRHRTPHVLDQDESARRATGIVVPTHRRTDAGA